MTERSGATEERLIIALERCASKLQSLGRTFSSTNFTDRYGDGPACLAPAKYAHEVCDDARKEPRSETAPYRPGLEAVQTYLRGAYMTSKKAADILDDLQVWLRDGERPYQGEPVEGLRKDRGSK